ncbi:MAG: DUF1295 domain-containing protein [Candidatus Heimdallarchaeota archaeon]|nr:DUF1295 domain-containing protein [Candidatus Heimdallarchaeota archaeon]
MTKNKSSGNVSKNDLGEDIKDISEKRLFSDLGQLVLLVVFAIIWSLDSFLFHFSNFLAKYIPLYVRLPIAIIPILFGLILAYLGFKQVFQEERDSPEVITKGVFGLIRHPTYLGAILIYVGWILTTLSLISLGMLVIIILFYNYIATHEEKVMVKQFGEEYETYKQGVPKWIPGSKYIQQKRD